MKLLLLFLFTLSATLAKPVESETEKYQCYAKHLRDKKLLDSSFDDFKSAESLECDEVIKAFRDTSIQESYLPPDTVGCFKEQLFALNYPEDMMKKLIYKKSTTLSKEQQTKLVKASGSDGEKKMKASLSYCLADSTFGEIFNEFIKPRPSPPDLKDRQSLYCTRKYFIDNKLIDTKVYTLNLNPDNIDVNFDCKNLVEESFGILQEMFEDDFKYQSYDNTKQRLCVSDTLKNEKGGEKVGKIFMLAEMTLTDAQKMSFRDEFVQNMKNLHLEMVKCFA